MLSSMHNDLIGEFKDYLNAQDVRNWAGFDPTHKPWPMDCPHGLSNKFKFKLTNIGMSYQYQ